MASTDRFQVLEIGTNRYPLKNGAHLIGSLTSKTTTKTISIQHDSVDEKHALIIAEDSNYFIYDLDSKNGTYINDERLAALFKSKLSDDVVVRFGTVEGRLSECSTLEQHHSSGFHDESMHLQLELTAEAENMTIPETQCLSFQQNVLPDSSTDNKDISNETSIPETQNVLDLIANNEAERDKPEDEMESQFIISTQDYNDCFEDDSDSGSRDLLDNLGFLVGDGQATAIKQTDKVNNDEQVKSSDVINNANSQTNEDIEKDDNDDLRSMTHTPDLFDVVLLEEFDKKEARMKNARANRSQNKTLDDDAPSTSKANKEPLSEERAQTASEVSLSHQDLISKPTSPPLLNSNKSDSREKILPEHSNSSKRAHEDELDLFEAEKVQADQADQPLEHSNKENMLLLDGLPSDFEPTQVYVKKTIKPPTMIEPMQPPVTSLRPQLPSAIVADNTDLEPTQVFVPKKYQNKNANATEEPPIPIRTTLLAPPADEIDLEPTQKFIPKKLTKNTNTSTPKVKTSETVQSFGSAAPKCSVKNFFADVENRELEQEEPGTSADAFEALETPRILTPEIISNSFSEQKVADAVSCQKALNESDSDSDSDDSITRLFNAPRCENYFMFLMDALEKSKQSNRSIQENNETDLVQKYITTGTDESQVKINSSGTKVEHSENSSSSSSSRRNKRNTTKKSVIDKKRMKIEEGFDIERDRLEKLKNKRDEEKAKRAQKLKRAKTDDDSDAGTSKVMKLQAQASYDDICSKYIVPISGRPTRNTNPLVDGASVSVANQQRRRDGKASSSSTRTRSSSKDNGERKVAKPTPSSSKGHCGTENRKTSGAGDEDNGSGKTASKILSRLPSDSKRAAAKTDIPSKNKPRGGRKEPKVDTKAFVESETSGAGDEDNGKGKKASKLSPSDNKRAAAINDIPSKNKPRGGRKEPKVDTKNQRNQRTSARLRSRSIAPSTDTSQDLSKVIDEESKSTKSRRDKKNSKDEPKPTPLQSSSSIIEVQGKGTCFNVPNTTSSSHDARPKMKKDKKDEEKPTTSAAARRTKAANAPQIDDKSVIKLAFTMVDAEKREELLQQPNKKWQEVTDPTDCEVLVMDSGNRTLKFLIAASKGIPIVTSKWLDAIKDTGVVSVRSNYFFKDPAFERNFKFSLLKTLNSAKKAKLFTNFEFLCTNNLIPSPADMKMIITCAGGTLFEKENLPVEKDKQELYLISSEKDRPDWHSYRRKNKNLHITSTEAVMLAIMRYDAKLLKKGAF